jgi:hypothetical protein
MQNMQTLIYIKDNIENTHYIYTNDLTIDYGFVKCYDLLREQYRTKYTDSLVDLRYTITEDRCDIFCDEEIILHGWIWNSKDKKQKVLYELTKIPVLSVKELIAVETISVETMTEPTLNEYKDKNKTHLQKLYNCNPNPDPSDFFRNISYVTNNLPDWFSNELEPIIENIGKLTIGNEGYATNPFNPINNGNPFLKYNENTYTGNIKDALNLELKDKLSEPNLGLRLTKRRKKLD